MPRPLVIANWKMHGRHAGVAAFAQAAEASLRRMHTPPGFIFCPPAPYLCPAAMALPANAITRLGAQDCADRDDGASTGEISAHMLADCGASTVILGHSERRAMGESDAQVTRKAAQAIAAGLVPILCVGESAAERAAGETLTVLRTQCQALQSATHGAIVVAYEPLWAIGTGNTPQADEIARAHDAIHSVLGSDITVVYGGSVNPANIAQILAIRQVSGVLVGGASLQMASLQPIFDAAATVRT